MLVWAGVMAFRGRAKSPFSVAKRGLTAEFCETQNLHHKREAHTAGTERSVVNPIAAVVTKSFASLTALRLVVNRATIPPLKPTKPSHRITSSPRQPLPHGLYSHAGLELARERGNPSWRFLNVDKAYRYGRARWCGIPPCAREWWRGTL
jgi:hypothetical protein